ncbi:MAG: 2-isopropylmalate synthase, partial [Armatimonadetes bacterium]|nr:2-isopropylmalate synthase [Armatimonadota bacterium]NIO75129.1 2-isopropylmalate synthase [Armatimonadota bacterium]NIO95753.1 2-isopropylmalate synthase [Armatimonadota bacterium]
GPMLFREVFPYHSAPLIPFNHRVVPMQPPAEIWITDTTFRDGQQSRPPFSAKHIVDLYEMLHRLGGPEGKIRFSEFFLYTDKDREAATRCLEKGYRYPEVTGWIRANKKDFRFVKKMGLKETGILCSVSDYHIFNKLQKTRRQAIDSYLGIVRAALEEGIVPRCHLEDITRADFYGFVVPLVQELMKLSAESGIPVKIRACDTLGYGVTYPGASIPRSVKGLIYGLVRHANVPSECLEWHGHNDFYKVLINATTAWLYGCCGANGALLGIGERTGNTPVEALVFEYIGLRGSTDGMDTRVITEIARYFEDEIGYQIPPNQPFVGRDFNLTRAGIHADGLSKDEEIYNIFDTDKVLNRPPQVAITDKSGLAGIAHWINQKFKLTGDNRLDKQHPGIAKINEAIMMEYDAGRTTSVSEEELIGWVQNFLPKLLSSE